MSDPAAIVHERGLARIGVGAVLTGAVALVLGASWQTTVVIVAGATAAALAAEYVDQRQVRASTRHLAFGVSFCALAVAWLVSADAVLAPGFALVVGIWFALDGAVARRYDLDDPGSEDELAERFDGMGFRERVETFRDLGEVGRALEDEPATPAELAARVEKSEAAVREDLELLQNADLVERDGETFRRTDRERGARAWLRRTVSRLFRPFRALAA